MRDEVHFEFVPFGGTRWSPPPGPRRPVPMVLVDRIAAHGPNRRQNVFWYHHLGEGRWSFANFSPVAI
jgi:hypothetical protein